MNMTEVARLLLGLRAAGWSEKQINDFVLYIESGEEQYKPTADYGKTEQCAMITCEYFMGYLFMFINADKRESIERWFTAKGYRSFNEYVCALIDRDMGI